MIYDSDKHGFNNPKGIWAGEGLEIAVVGDSFTQGFCVPQGQDMVAPDQQTRDVALRIFTSPGETNRAKNSTFSCLSTCRPSGIITTKMVRPK